MYFPLKTTSKLQRRELDLIIYNSRNDFPHLSASLITVDGHHGRASTRLSDRLYLVLDGVGEFSVGEQTYYIQPMDVIIVPRGSTYDIKGQLKIFMVHSPAFDGTFENQIQEKQ